MIILLRIVLTLTFIASVVLSFSLGWYALENDSGHTGIPVLRATVVLQGLVLIAGVLGLCVDLRQKKIHLTSVLCSWTAVLGMFFGAFLHYSRVLCEYHVWIRSGMPEPSPYRNTYVYIAMFVLLFGILGTFKIFRKWIV